MKKAGTTCRLAIRVSREHVQGKALLMRSAAQGNNADTWMCFCTKQLGVSACNIQLPLALRYRRREQWCLSSAPSIHRSYSIVPQRPATQPSSLLSLIWRRITSPSLSYTNTRTPFMNIHRRVMHTDSLLTPCSHPVSASHVTSVLHLRAKQRK